MNKSINLDFKIPIWKPDKEQIKESNLTRYIEWLNKEKNLKFIDYHDLWQWSVDNIECFWLSISEFFNIELDEFSKTVLE